MPKLQLKHPILNPTGDNELDFSNDANGNKFKKIGKTITPKEFINLISGKYGHAHYNLDSIKEKLKDHPHDNEKNIDIAVRQMVKEGDTSRLASLLEHYHVSPKVIDDIIDNPEKYGKSFMSDHASKNNVVPDIIEAIAGQKNLSSEHIHKIATNESPFVAREHLLRHKNTTPEAIKDLVSNPNANMTHGLITGLVDIHKEKPEIIGSNSDTLFRKILDRHKNLNIVHMDKVLGVMSPEARNKFIDDKLGITDGNHIENDQSPEDNWQNWENGTEHNVHIASSLPSSKYLTDAHADHIKRHGDLDDRFNLFQNENLDSKHADEMYQKWIEDDTHHGFDRDEFQEKLKEYNEFNFEDYMDEAREKAEEEYPMSEFMRDSYRNNEEDLVGKDREEWIQDHLQENHDWTHKNPTDEDPDNEEDYSHSIDEHPEYQNRYSDAEDQYDKHVEHLMSNPEDHHYDGYSESISDREYEIAQEIYDDKMANAHEDPDFLPNHLTSITELKRRVAERKQEEAFKEAAKKERESKPVIDRYIPNRQNVHSYGEGQHHLEMAKDYADANGGSIDIGHLNKLHPNMVEKWKGVFAGKGKLKSEEIQSKIDSLPKKNYNLSYGHWGPDDMQNINKQHEMVVRLDHSPETLAEIQKDPEVHDVFNKINELAQRSGHPTNFNTIGWSRVDFTDPKHPMIDELQSDFSSTARDYLKKEGGAAGEAKAKAIDKIIGIHKNWRETLLNAVIKTAKAHGAEKISTHSAESKSAHTGSDKVHSVYKDSYEKIPRQLGFKESQMDTLPLSEEGKKTFYKGKSGVSTNELISDHLDGMATHSRMWNQHAGLALEPSDDSLVDTHKALADHHNEMYKQHQSRLATLDPSHSYRNLKTPGKYMDHMGVEPSHEDRNAAIDNAFNITTNNHSKPVYGFDSALKQQELNVKAHSGHTLNLSPESMKKSLMVSNLLIKSQSNNDKLAIAQALLSIQSKKDQIDALQQSNPEAYKSIAELTQTLVELFKEINNEPIEAAMHEVEATQEMAPEQQGQPETESSVAPPRHADKLTHGSRELPVGSVRDYKPGVAREKLADGSWVSVAGGTKRFDGQ